MTAQLEARPNRIGLASWLVGHTRRLLPPLTISVLARIVNQLLGIALLVIAATAILHAATGRGVSPPQLIGWLIGVALAKAMLRYLEHYAGHWVAFTALQRLRELFFARLIPQAPAATRGKAGAELTERATRDIDRIEVFFAHTLPPAVSAIVVPAIALTWLGATVNGLLAAVVAPFVAAVALVIPLLAGQSTWRGARRVAARRGQLAEHLGDDIQGVREILGFGIQNARLEELDHAGRALTAARSRVGAVQAVRAALISATQAIGLVVIVLVAVAATVPVTDVVLTLAVAIGLWGPARGTDDFASGLDAAFASTARIRHIIDAEPAVQDAEAPQQLFAKEGEGHVEFDAVTFRYPENDTQKPVLDRVSARFAPGTWSYVVGVSGSGKSTLAQLLLRGWDVDTGAIKIDGISLRDLALDNVRHRIALVSQRPTMLSGTLAENLRLASPDATDDDLWAALATAALDDWVEALPHGLATPVRERGLDVSGGQLQRIALARALVANPDVLVLDEALSQLDADTARRVRDRLASYRPGLTVIEITHRADLIPGNAHVLVIDDGRLIETGDAAKLRSNGAAFTRLEARN